MFSSFSFIKTLDPFPDPDSLEMLDPDPEEIWAIYAGGLGCLNDLLDERCVLLW